MANSDVAATSKPTRGNRRTLSLPRSTFLAQAQVLSMMKNTGSFVGCGLYSSRERFWVCGPG